MEFEELFFSECCQNFALDAPLTFISSFPGVIVFGKVNKQGFVKGKCFKFGVFEIYKLYISILNILSFFTSNEKDIIPALIVNNEEENYFWSGKTVVKNNKTLKLVKFGIEREDNISFELCFYLKQFQHFFFCLEKVILSSLCLLEEDGCFFEFMCEQMPETYKTTEQSKICIEMYLKKQSSKVVNSKRESLHNLITYYKEISIIIFKLRSLQIPVFRQNVVEQLFK
jgi:hypothetical protein